MTAPIAHIVFIRSASVEIDYCLFRCGCGALTTFSTDDHAVTHTYTNGSHV